MKNTKQYIAVGDSIRSLASHCNPFITFLIPNFLHISQEMLNISLPVPSPTVLHQ